MGPAGSADRDDLDGRIGQHIGQLVIRPAANFLCKAIGALGPDVEAGNQFRASHILDRRGMKPRDHSATDDAEAEHGRLVSC